VLQITPWERTALQLLADGALADDIADRLKIRDRDIDSYLTTLFTRMGAASRAEAVVSALRRGLLKA
jgi:DNA-binding NarL/FixJ family response regulator